MSANWLEPRRRASTRLTASNSSAQSMAEISRMLVMMLRTVTFEAPWRCCACSTASSTVSPCCARRSSSQPSAGMVRGSWPRRRLASCAATRSGNGPLSRSGTLLPGRGRCEHRVGDRVGLGACTPPGGDLVGQPPQVLDQDDAQRDGDRPELADRERLHLRVGRDEAPQQVRVELAVGMGHERPGEAEHARIALERTIGELGQLPVIGRWQVAANLADLRLHQMVIIQQPLRRRRDALAGLHVAGDGSIGKQQSGGVVVQPVPQRPNRNGHRRDRLGRSERACMMLEPFRTEQFLTHRTWIVPGRPGPAVPRDADQPIGPGRLGPLRGRFTNGGAAGAVACGGRWRPASPRRRFAPASPQPPAASSIRRRVRSGARPAGGRSLVAGLGRRRPRRWLHGRRGRARRRLLGRRLGLFRLAVAAVLSFGHGHPLVGSMRSRPGSGGANGRAGTSAKWRRRVAHASAFCGADHEGFPWPAGATMMAPLDNRATAENKE